ncbi:MAG: PKD domain-containing protein [archaeon]
MRNLTLSIILMLGVLLASGFVVADDNTLNGVEFTNPTTGEWHTGNILVEWTNDDEIDNLYLKYREGNCLTESSWNLLLGGIESDLREFPWEVLSLDGDYCLRLGDSDEFSYSGQFCIDNDAPEVAICVGCCFQEGIESDYEHEETITEVKMNLNDDSWNGGYSCESCNPMDYCTIDWGDGSTDDCSDVCESDERSTIYEYECHHQYADSGLYDVSVSVEDCARNVGEGMDTVEVENIIPECEIDAPTDAAVGQEVDFAGIISNLGDWGEVNADMVKMLYDWDFDDGNNDSGQMVTHIFTSEGEYMVMLTVDDTDGGVSSCYHTIDVVEPIVLDNQEVAAFYPLEVEFGVDGVDRSFYTGLTNTVECRAVNAPENLRTKENMDAPNTCRVRWDKDSPPPCGLTANPTNDERGVHNVVIRAENAGGDYEYYAFDITVWSWIIPLYEGWNLISVPLVPENSNAIEDVILDQIYDQLPTGNEYGVWSYQYDGTDSNWLKSRRSGYGDLDTIMLGYGYWVQVTADTVIKGYGTQIDAFQGLPPSIEVQTDNWAMIGKYGILGKPWHPFMNLDKRVHGYLTKGTALESLNLPGFNELHTYGVDEMV